MDYLFTKQDENITVFDFPWNLIHQQCNSWKAGQRGKLAITKLLPSKTPQQLGYYYAMILPQAVKAFLANKDYTLKITIAGHVVEVEMTLTNMDSFLKERYEEVVGKKVSKADMDIEECSAYETWCIDWIKIWLKCTVPPADKNWRENA